MGFAEDLAAFEASQPKVVSGDFAKALAPKFTKGTSFAEDLAAFELTQETGRPATKKIVLHDNADVKKASNAPRTFRDDLNDFEQGKFPQLDDSYRKKTATFGRAALYVLGAEENFTVAKIRESLGKTPHADYLENTYGNLFKEWGAPDNLTTEALGLVVSIATAPSTYLSFGVSGALKLAKGATLTSKGLKLANAVARDRLEEKIAEKAAKGITLTDDAVNVLARDTKAQVEKELVTKFEGINGARRALGKDVKELPDSIFDLGGIKLFGHSLVEGKTVAKVAEESGLTKLGEALVQTKVGQGVGKFLFRDFQVDKQLLESVDDAQRASAHIFNSKMKSTERWFSGMSQAQKNNFFDSMYKATTKGETGTVKALTSDPVVQDRIDRWLAQGAYKGRSSIADRFAKYSKLFDEEKIPSWFPLIDKRFAEQATKLELPKTLEPASREFLKERSKLGQHITDPVMSIAIRRTQVAMANLQDKVYQNVIDKGLGGLKTFKTAAEADIAGYERLTPPLVDRIKRSMLEGKVDFKIPVGEHYVTKEFARQYKSLMYDQTVHVPVLSYLTGLWKSHVTSNLAFPSYFVRNFTSNIVQNAMKIGGHAIDPKKNILATMMITGKSMQREFKTDIGEKLSLAGVLKEAEDTGLLGKGQFIADLGGTTLNPKDRTAWSWFTNQMNIFNPNKFFLTRVGRNFGTALENQAKLVNYMTWRAKGLSPKIAAMEATEALFDYSAITKGEQWAKLAIPFYVFSRKNLGLSAKVFAQRPAILGAQLKAIRDLGPTEDEWESLPRWAQDKFVFNFRNSFQQGLGLPIEDLMEFISNPARQLILRSNPVFRMPVERMAGIDFFSKRPLIDVRNAKEFAGVLDAYEDSRTPKALKAALSPIVKFLDLTHDPKTDKVVGDPNSLHLVRSSFTSRYQSVIGMLKDDEKDGWEKALRWGLGFVRLDSNPELNQNIKNRELDNELMEKFQRKNLIRVLRKNIPVGGAPSVKQKVIDIQKRTEKADSEFDRQTLREESDQLIEEER